MFKLSRYKKSIIILVVAIILLVIPGFFPRACDWYTDHIYPTLCDIITFVTKGTTFAIGEIMMYLGMVMLLAVVVLSVLLIFLRKRYQFRNFCVGYYKAVSIILLCTVLVYLVTWYIPFRGTVLGRGDANQRTEYSYDELYNLLSYIVYSANAAAKEIEVSEDGSVEFRTPEESCELAAQAMAAIGDEYPRLKGYYPQVKPAICSDVLDRMNIGGYNYPFTMEPTRNKYVDPLYVAVLEAHELAHHKGYYKENEANFLSEIALSRSEDPYLRLAAYINMYYYVNDEFLTLYSEMKDEKPKLSDRAVWIEMASEEKAQELYDADEHAIDNMPAAVDDAIHKTADKGWETQGEVLKENSYDGVVLLLLQEYYK